MISSGSYLSHASPDAARMHAALVGAGGDGSLIDRALHAVRAHLGLQVAYVSEFVHNEAVFRHVDAPGLEHLAKPGDAHSLDDIYCRHILDGRLPQLIPDTAKEPIAAALPVTAATPIGAHVSVPLRMADGAVYGMFCCLGPVADPTLNDRDLNMMRAFAEIAAFEIDRERSAGAARRDKVARIRDAIDGGQLEIAYQPIWSLTDSHPIGVESLARFTIEPRRTPDLWFAEASDVGLGEELELVAIDHALAALARLPDQAYVAVNASPSTALSGALPDILQAHPLHRVVLEITEHGAVEDFDRLAAAIEPLRARGLRLAVDDAGAGYSGLQQILQMRPDLIKLDRSLIHGIGDDPGRRALAAALTMFARETGSRIIAEGVETEAELAMLRALGVDTVQGYLLGWPQAIDHVAELFAVPARAADDRRDRAA